MKPIFIGMSLYNRLVYTKQCIQSIIDTCDPDLYELNLVDDGSNDGTKEYLIELNKQHPEFNIYIFNEQIPSEMKPLNFLLLRKHQNQYWMCMDNDVVHIQNGWMNKLLYAFDKDALLGYISLKPPIIDINNEVFPMDLVIPLEHTYAVPHLTAMARPSVIDDLGFYAEFYPWTGPDYDWGMRVVKSGSKCGYYCSKRTNPDDYIDVIDLGRNENELKVEGEAYYNWKIENDKLSMRMVGEELHKIVTGERQLYLNTSMINFSGYYKL